MYSTRICTMPYERGRNYITIQDVEKVVTNNNIHVHVS